MYSVVMQGLREIVIDRSKRKTVKMGVKDGLAEYAMLPKDDRSIIPGQELLDFAFQRKQFRVKFGGNCPVTGIVLLRYDQQVTFHQWGVICGDEECRGLFEYVGREIAALAKFATGTTRFDVGGREIPILHANDFSYG